MRMYICQNSSNCTVTMGTIYFFNYTSINLIKRKWNVNRLSGHLPWLPEAISHSAEWIRMHMWFINFLLNATDMFLFDCLEKSQLPNTLLFPIL